MTDTTVIVVDHAYSYLVPQESEAKTIVRIVDDVTSWKDPGYFFAAKKLGRWWDGKTRLLSKKKLQFPTGLVNIVVEALEEEGYSVTVEDHRMYPEISGEVAFLTDITLRGYQEDAVRAALKAKCGVISLPSGTGKTETMVSLVASLKAFPVLWLTHTAKLREQTFDRFKSRLQYQGISIGKIGEGVWNPRDVTVAMIQTLSSKFRRKQVIELLQNIQMFVSDEAHHVPSSKWFKLLMKCGAPFRYGCSATPLDRKDGSDLCLIGSTGEIVYEMTPQEGAALGIFEVPKIVFVRYLDNSCTVSQGYSRVDWMQLYREQIVENEDRNDVIVEICKRSVKQGRKILLLVKMIKHGRILEKRLRDWFTNDLHTTFVWGASSSSIREEVIRKFQDGICKVLIASSIFDEGADIPQIDTVVIAAAGKSAIKAMQRAGRGMRKSDGKSLIVYDFEDGTHPILLRHSRTRKKVYEKRGLTDIETVRVVI